MPRLDNGFELLALIFAFVFASGSLLVGRRAVLKTMILAMFVMMTGISNQQSYSFIGLVNAALMMLLALGIISVVQILLSPYRPEQVFLHHVRRFFRGCARVTSGFVLGSPADQTNGRRLRKRYFQSMVLPAPGKIQATQKHLDDGQHPQTSPEKMQRLIDSLQDIVFRLQALEIAHRRIAPRSSEIADSFISHGRQVQEAIRRVFERWAELDQGAEVEKLRDELQQLAVDLERQFSTLEAGNAQDDVDDQMVTDLYTMLGSSRGLIAAMARAQEAMNQINWPALATTRF
jgi:uncharacterized membrane protein YccC